MSPAKQKHDVVKPSSFQSALPGFRDMDHVACAAALQATGDFRSQLG